MRQLLRVLIAVLALTCAASAQESERRVALVIGVNAYDPIAPLTNPIADAERVHQSLTRAGFDVGAPVIDPTEAELEAALLAFSRRANRADVAVLYFAGHGMQLHNENWLLPRDARLERPQDIRAEAIRLSDVIAFMEGARLRILFIDACRNDPYRLVPQRSVRGLAGVPEEDLPEGTVIAFAAAAGQPAEDDGAFARLVAEQMVNEGLTLEQMLSRVRDGLGREIEISDRRRNPASFLFMPGLSEEDRFWLGFQQNMNSGRCDAARADLMDFAARNPAQRSAVNVVVASVLPTCRPAADSGPAHVAARPDFLASLTAADRAPLTRADYEASAQRLGVEWEALAAAVAVESGPLGSFAEDGRLIILFERHMFSRRTNSRYDASHPSISNRAPGGYPRTQAERWAQLELAYSLDPVAALSSASYGRFQVLGQNYTNLGFENPHDYIVKLARSERDQLEAFEGFLRAYGLVDELQRRDWAGFARLYNGPNYAQNQLDARMAEMYARLKANPDEAGGAP